MGGGSTPSTVVHTVVTVVIFVIRLLLTLTGAAVEPAAAGWDVAEGTVRGAPERAHTRRVEVSLMCELEISGSESTLSENLPVPPR